MPPALRPDLPSTQCVSLRTPVAQKEGSPQGSMYGFYWIDGPCEPVTCRKHRVTASNELGRKRQKLWNPLGAGHWQKLCFMWLGTQTKKPGWWVSSATLSTSSLPCKLPKRAERVHYNLLQ